MFTGIDIVQFFRDNAALAVFLTVAVGFWIGKFRYKSFSLGTVTSVLLVGVAVGQMKIEIPEPAKTLFFLMFLFAVGYAVGPQFFRGLRKDGLPQVGFAVVLCLLCLGSVWLCSWVMGYDAAQAAGLMAGSQTMSAVLGVATDTMHEMPDSATLKYDIMPVVYAVTYIYGTAGSAWLLGTLGPRLLGGVDKVKAAARELESKMGEDMSAQPGFNPAVREITFRAFRADNEWFDPGRTVADFEREMQRQGKRLFVERLRQQGRICEVTPRTMIFRGDEIVVSGRREFVIEEEEWIGEEVVDNDLVNFRVETLAVVVGGRNRRKETARMSIRALLKAPFMHGVMIRSITRAGVWVPVLGEGRLDTGDRLELVGLRQDVERAAGELGFSDPETPKSSMTFVGLGIVLGGLIFGWMLVTRIGSIPLSLTVSGGVLIAGLVCGWLRARRPDFGGVPEPAVWFMNNVGLNVFIAIVGISTGPTFIRGLQEMGWSVLLVGVVATSIPLVSGIFIGKYLFRFNDALTLGCCSGARTTTAALGAVEETLGSNVPAMGYTITYAVGNTLLIIWGVVIVLLVG
ncbi:aspartate-alanine antiporter [uncultured Rikenella sp.]|uniref:aspartate-alanine antiporter n=1 Tax=uncultured Rikenella sp. TaxID=368003 RepID=UPI0025E89EA7|nr:aspartate-alanine antiporter [uncultured Rikenella sp.]